VSEWTELGQLVAGLLVIACVFYLLGVLWRR